MRSFESCEGDEKDDRESFMRVMKAEAVQNSEGRSDVWSPTGSLWRRSVRVVCSVRRRRENGAQGQWGVGEKHYVM